MKRKKYLRPNSNKIYYRTKFAHYSKPKNFGLNGLQITLFPLFHQAALYIISRAKLDRIIILLILC